jgi:hypothetical protein
VPKRAIAVRLNVKSTTTTIANVVPSLAVAVLSLVARWQQQWCNEQLLNKKKRRQGGSEKTSPLLFGSIKQKSFFHLLTL